MSTPKPNPSEKQICVAASIQTCVRHTGVRLVWSGKQKAQEGGKKPLLRIIAGNSFNGSRWKTALNAGGNFANYGSMHLSNLILGLPPFIFLSRCCFFPLILHSWVLSTFICYTPSFLRKTPKHFLWSNIEFPGRISYSEIISTAG